MPPIDSRSITEQDAAALSAFDERQFRDALAQFATGVTIVCTRAGPQRYVGFTANSFNSVSLEPPLVLWTIARQSASLAAFEAAERYAVNVLAAEQAELARRFSRPRAAQRSTRRGTTSRPRAGAIGGGRWPSRIAIIVDSSCSSPARRESRMPTSWMTPTRWRIATC